MDTPKRPRGRPPAAPGEALDAKLDMRVTQALKDKVEKHGHHWARKVLERAKPPKDAE